MSPSIGESLLRDDDGAPETVYVTAGQRTVDVWRATSLDVGSWRPLAVGDRVVALDRQSPAEFVVEVATALAVAGEAFYELRHIADLDPATEPGLANTRS